MTAIAGNGNTNMIRKAIIVVLTLSAVMVGASFLTLFSKPYPRLTHGPARMSNGGIDYDWTWGRAGSHIVLTRVLRSEQVGRSVLIERPGFAISKGGNLFYFAVSIWIPLATTTLLAAYPTIAFIRGPVRRWRRRRKGLCIKCAYDLTGNVPGVCPECGTEVAKETAPSDRLDD